MSELKIPALEYCSLERATRLIGGGCEVEDLLHWALIGKIRLAVNFTDYVSTFRLNFMSDDVDRIVEVLVENQGFYNGEYYVSPHSIFSSHVIPETEDELRAHFSRKVAVNKNFPKALSFHGSIRGVWDVYNVIYDEKRDKKYIFDVMMPLDDSFGLPTSVVTGEFLGVSPDEFLISRKYINIIMGGAYENLADIPYLDKENIIIDDTDKEPGAKTNTQIRNRASFLKALLLIHYGEDVAERPRKHIDNSRSKLRRDFELAGIELPTGKTVEGWLDGIMVKK